MELFKLTDITFEKEKTRTFDPAKVSQFSTETYRYPLDIGREDKGHYVVFYVNEQIATEMAGNKVDGINPTIRSERTASGEAINAGSIINEVSSALRNLSDEVLGGDAAAFLVKTFGPTTAAGMIAGGKEFTNDFLRAGDTITAQGFTRTVRRISDTFVMYMPDTVAYTFNQNYTNVNMGGGAFALTASAGKSIVDITQALKDPTQLGQIIGKGISPFVATGLQKVFGDQSSFVFQNLTGTVINPQLELLYTSPNFRNFSFEFMFYPRNPAEARRVMSIIRMFEFHQAPEIKSGNAGFFLVPPSEFDIEFHYNGKVNPNLPKYTTSVLTSMDVDYAPNGFSAYELMGDDTPSAGGTGMPVAIRITLNFQEVDFRTKKTLKAAYGLDINR
jgi:hypothetical protein